MRKTTKIMLALGLAAGVGLTLSANESAKAEGVYVSKSGSHVRVVQRRGYEAMASADACPAGGWVYRPHIGHGPWLCDPTPSIGTCKPGTVMIEGLCRLAARAY